MKKMMKRLISMILALVLITSQLALPAMAEDNTSGTPAAQLDQSTPLPAPAEESSSSSTTIVENPPSVSEVTVESWVSSTETPASNPAPVDSPDNAPTPGTGPATGPDVTQQTTGNVVVTKEGTQTTTVTNAPGSVSQEITGNETITTDDTTKTVITEEFGGEQGVNPEGVLNITTPDTASSAPAKEGTFTETGSMDGFDPLSKEYLEKIQFQEDSKSQQKIEIDPPATSVTLTASQSEITGSSITKSSEKFTLEDNQILPSVFFQQSGENKGEPYANNSMIDTDGDGKTDTFVQYGYDANGDVNSVTATKVTSEENKTAPTQEQWQQAGWDNDPTNWNSDPQDQGQDSVLPVDEYLEVTPKYNYNGTDHELPPLTAADYQRAIAGADANGKFVEEIKDKDGNVITTRTFTLQKNGADEITGFTVEDVFTMDDVDPSLIPQGGSTEITPALPQRPVAAADKEENGKRITESVTDIMDGGKVTGYRKTVTTTDIATGEVKTETQDFLAGSESFSKILPTKPVPAAPKEENGLRITEEVTEITQNGELMGYRLTTTQVIIDTGEIYRTDTHDYLGGTQTYKENVKVTMDEANTKREITLTTDVSGIKNTKVLDDSTQTTLSNLRELAQEVYRLNGNVDDVYLQYKGTFYRVQAGGDHGKVSNITQVELGLNGEIYTVRSWQPDLSKDGSWRDVNGDGKASIDEIRRVSSGKKPGLNNDTDLITGFANDTGAANTGSKQWDYYAFGLESRVKALKGAGQTEVTHQYVLRDGSGNQVYAYCMDANTKAVRGSDYNMDNVKDSGYTTKAGYAEHLEMIAVNGYWGTKGGEAGPDGSLADVKEFLKSQIRNATGTLKTKLDELKVTEADVDQYLSDGLALTATQGALWYYGRNDGSTANQNAMMANIVGYDLSSTLSSKNDENGALKADINGGVNRLNDYSNGNQEWLTNGEIKVVNALFRALVLQDIDQSKLATEFIGTDNFATTTAMTVQGRVTAIDKADIDNYGGKVKTEQVTDADGNTVERAVKDTNGNDIYVDASGNDLYKGDISFTVDLKLNDLTGNMIAKVYTLDENGNHVKQIASAQIGTERTNILGKFLITPGGDSQTFTFQNLILADGVSVNLVLEGTQRLREGAYLYSVGSGSYKDSQTFIGVASGDRQVDLNVKMKFEAVDPNAKVEYIEKSGQDEKKATFTRTQDGAEVTNTVTVESSARIRDVYKGTRVTTKVLSKNIREERSWNAYLEYLMTTTSGDGGEFFEELGGQGGGNPGGLTIPDEAVPLAAAPKTGDVSQVLATICLISLSGAYLLSRKRFIG